MADTVVEQVAERLDIPPSEARLVLNALSKLIHQQAAQEGRVRVPGIGIFERVTGDDTLQFTPDAALERVVNHRYAGMAPAAAAPSVTETDAAETDAAHQEGSATEREEATADERPAQETPIPTAPVKDPRVEDAPVEDAADAAEDELQPPSDQPDGDDTKGPDTEDDPRVAPEDDTPAEAETAEEPDAVPVVAGAVAGAGADESAESKDEPVDADEPEAIEAPDTVTEEAAPNRTPAIIGLVLAFLLAAGAAWWLLTDEPATAPETPDMAVVEPEPADETEQTPPDAAPDPAEADNGDAEALEEAVVPDAPDALADGVSSDDLPDGAGTIDPTLGGFALVVASVPSEADAEAIEANYRDTISDDPLPMAVLVSQIGDATRYRVGVGQFATQEEALAARDTRADVLPGDAWVLRLTPAMARN